MNKYIAMCFVLFSLSGCGDGVPELKDPANPIGANGNVMTKRAFYDEYCVGKYTNKTCILVAQAIKTSQMHGPMIPGW